MTAVGLLTGELRLRGSGADTGQGGSRATPGCASCGARESTNRAGAR